MEGRLVNLEKNMEAGFEGINKKLDEIESEFGNMKSGIERNTLAIGRIMDHLNLT